MLRKKNDVINGNSWVSVIAVLLKKGIVVGIEQNITLQTTLGLLQFRLITKVTHEYILQLLRRRADLY